MERPMDVNFAELTRLREAVKAGQPIDWPVERRLADFDIVLAGEVYSMEAVDRVIDQDDKLESLIDG